MIDQRAILHRILVSASFLIAFLLLNRPEVILLSKLGTVVWYPAAGLSLALLLGVSPSYGLLVVLADALAGRLIYRQPFMSYGETFGAIGMGISYAAAAHLLRNVLKIDLGLRRRRDVVQYVAVTTIACLGSTMIGVACLAADHFIPWRAFWKASSIWFLGDEIALLGVSPFLLIHVFPWIRRQLPAGSTEVNLPQSRRSNAWAWIEVVAQVVALVVSLWMMFSPRFERFQLLYVSFVPVIWIAMRQGIQRMVSCLLALNFGVVVALHLFPPQPLELTQTRLLMFVLSGVGLIVGSAVTEQHRIATELLERTSDLLSANTQLVEAKCKAEEASRVKGEFLANMSHEIRTPINGILGMAELVLNTDLTDEQRENLGILKSSGDFLLGVINDVLDFSRVESGQLRLEEAEFDLRDVMGEALRGLSLRAHEKRLELAYHVDPKIPPRLVGDAGRLRQILLNLVGNAIKFTPSGEVIVRVCLDTSEDRDLVLEFTVVDTGIGVPKEKHSLIFEPFAQGDSSTTRHYGGTGLGLSICSRLAGLMCGRVWLESVEGEGSTFHFSVRLRIADPQAFPTQESHQELSAVPVLIVDDNSEVRQILSEITREWNMHPVTAESGAAAWVAIQQAEAGGAAFRLVIADSDMPDMNGFALAERIRQDRRFFSLPLLIMACVGASEAAGRDRDLGIAACLLKPIRRNELLGAILKALGKTSPKGDELSAGSCVPNAFPQLKILVAEDNSINQMVTVRMLEKLGHTSEVAANGVQALSMLQSGSFDLVLMDVQMPVKDGLATTREIREREKTTGAHIPVIAVTAHAIKGDRERCLAAGMDAYLTKPVTSQSLQQTIAATRGRAKPFTFSASAPCGSVDYWSVSKARENVGGDELLLRELLQIFLQESPKQLAVLEHAIETANAVIVESVAHMLKGELGYLGLADAAAQARDLEHMGHDRALKSAPDIFRQFKSNLLAASTAMHEVLDSHR